MNERPSGSFVSFYEPGQYVTHPTCPEWGMGQIQSVCGSRVTVNFEHSGKIVINAALIDLVMID